MKIRRRQSGETIADVPAETLRWANLRWADLSGANLIRADLSGADLSRADLSGASLCEADLREADLRNADLRGADLRNANLRWADLSEADLSGADLSGADLSGADLSRANLCLAIGCVALPVGDPRGYRAVAVWHGTHWHIFAGCRSFTVAQARDHWGCAYNGARETGDKYLLALDWLMRTHPVDPSITCSIQRRHLIQIQEAA